MARAHNQTSGGVEEDKDLENITPAVEPSEEGPAVGFLASPEMELDLVEEPEEDPKEDPEEDPGEEIPQEEQVPYQAPGHSPASSQE